MSDEKPLRVFRPISFDEREPASLLKAGQGRLLESNIAKPIPTSPTNETSFLAHESGGDVRRQHDDSEKVAEGDPATGADLRRLEWETPGTPQDIINVTGASIVAGNGALTGNKVIVPAPMDDASLDFRNLITGSPDCGVHVIPERLEPMDSLIALSDEESGQTSVQVGSPDSAKAVRQNEKPDQASWLPDLEQKNSAPLSTSSAFSLTCSIGPPTITSINTTNSLLSRRDSELVKPIPRRVRKSFVKIPSQADEGSAATATERSPTPLRTQSKTIPSGDPPSRSSSGSNGTLVLERKLSRKKGSRFRKLVSGSHQRSGTEPWGISKKKTLSSSSSSTTDVDETTGIGRQGSFERKSSRGQARTASGPLASLRLKRMGSHTVEESDGNPWFQERSRHSTSRETSEQDFLSRPRTTSEDLGLKLEKAKKIRFKKIGLHIFGKEEKDRAPTERYETKSSSSAESLTLASFSQEGSRVSHEDIRDSKQENDRLEKDVRRALSRKQGLEDVLDKVLALRERPPEDLPKLLFKFLSTNMAVENGMKLILGDDEAGSTENSGTTSLTEPGAHQTRRELLVHAYVTGPSRLRRAVLNHGKARGQLLAFLRGEGKSPKPVSEEQVFKVHCLAKILNSILLDNPSDVTELIDGNRGLLQSLVRNHIHVPEVVEFLCQLCAANALSDNAGDELRYGAPNAAGIVLISKEGLCDLLLRTFADSCDRNSVVPGDNVRWQVQVNSTKCLLELSKRSAVVLKFSKSNCSYSSKYIKTLNDALGSISSFENVDRVSRLLEAGLGCVQSGSSPCMPQEAAEDANAAICALSFVRELLDLVSSAGDSKSVVTRRTVGTINTKELENLIISKTTDMCRLLDGETYAGACGRMKVEIVKTFRSLFSSRSEQSRVALADNWVPECLLKSVGGKKLGSILHGCVVECIAASLQRETSGRLHRAWLSAIEKAGMMDEMVNILAAKSDGEQDREGPWSTYRSTLVDIGFILCMFSQNLTRAEFRGLFESEERYQTFIGKIEPGLGKVEESRRGACGGPKPEGTVVSVLANADALAAKINDFDAV